MNIDPQRKLNIGIVTTWFERGAAYVSKAYMRVLSNDHNVFVYARGGELYARNDPQWDIPNVHWGKKIQISVPGFILWRDFKEWVLTNKLDVIIFNEQQSWDIILRCLKLQVIIGAYIDYYTPQTVPFFRLYDFLLCNTCRHYSVFQDHPQAIYIPWGTDCDEFVGTYKPASETGVTFFHSCGLGSERKGTDILVKAFQQVHGDTKLIIHSQAQIVNEPIKQIIANDPRIDVVQKTVGPPGLYHLGDVYVYPTRLEGIGLTIAEAAASGLPVITTANAPMNEFVKPDVNGKLVEVERFHRRFDNYYWDESICSESQLAKAMQYYVDNAHKLEDFKKNARHYAERKLNWDKNSQELAGQLRELGLLEKPWRLVISTALYEYFRYPMFFFRSLRRKLIKSIGA